MSSAALAPPAVSRPAVNPWIVATAVVIPTFMEILDTTIATRFFPELWEVRNRL